MNWRAWLGLIAFVRVAACADIDPVVLLAHVRAKVVDDAKRIPRYVCRQQIERRIYLPDTRRRPKCPTSLPEPGSDAPPGTRLSSTDRAKLDVMLSNGSELFAWPGGRAFTAEDPGALLVGGMSGSGDFASFRIDIFTNPQAVIHYEAPCGASCARFDYEVPLASSHYVLTTARGSGKVGYRGTFDADSRTAEIVRFTVNATDVQQAIPSACGVRTRISYASADRFMMPSLTEKYVVLTDGSHLQSKTAYQGCRQYSAESTISFDDDSASAASDGASAPTVLPAPQTTLEVRLRSKINADTGSAGDAIEGILTRSVRDNRGGSIPRGTVVRGHLAQLAEQYTPTSGPPFARPRTYPPREVMLVTLRFDSIVLGGREVPITLEPEGDADEHGRGVFYFPNTKAIGQEFVSKWRVR